MATATERNQEVFEWIKSLGIDPKKARRVTLDVSVDHPATVFAEMFTDVDSIKAFPQFNAGVLPIEQRPLFPNEIFPRW